MSKPKGAMGSPYCDGSMTEMFNKAAGIMTGEHLKDPPKKPEIKTTDLIPQPSACPASNLIVDPAAAKTMDALLRPSEAFTKDTKKELMSMPSKVGWELEELSASHATFTLKSGQQVSVRA